MSRLLDDASYCLSRAKKLRESAQSKLAVLTPMRIEATGVAEELDEMRIRLVELNKEVDDGLADIKALADRADFFSTRARKLINSNE